MSTLDQKAVNIIKGLIMDATRKANSGHPGGAMSSADFAYILYKEFLNFDPDNPRWFNRDRFVLSAGHESMLLYSLLTFCDFLKLDDLKNFRQLGSRTPGHPEFHRTPDPSGDWHDLTPGVEATTGPLGQGFAMAVGMAVAESFLRAKLGENICDHYTYVLASDGDMQEPIVLGSAALAGHWSLNKLIVFYDSNKIQLSGPTSRCDVSDYKKIFEGFCWQVIEIDGHDHEQIRMAIKRAREEKNRPSLIIGHTTMARGSAHLEGSEATHGSPFSPEEIKATKEKLGLPTDREFYLPDEILDHFRSRFPDLRGQAKQWHKTLNTILSENSEVARFWRFIHTPPEDISLSWPEFDPAKPLATRKAFGQCLNKLIDQLPNLMGGSADLDPSNQTVHFRETVGIFNNNTNPQGRYLPFGVREFPMGAILNGLALHGGIIPLGATFLVFSDYERSAIRMSALQKLPVLHIFTHDSFYVGEDGPTHQPVEHISSLRLIPNLLVFRPADANESKFCFSLALKQDKRPSVLVFTRQGLPVLDLNEYPQIKDGIKRGAYILLDPPDHDPEIILMASGSEVHLAISVAKALTSKKIRVISVPCMELFDEQNEEYKQALLPNNVRQRFAIEAGRGDIWYKYVGLDGAVFGMDQFGASAPAHDLAQKYGFTPDQIIEWIKERI
jgi:transketolase